jgi:myo-inositol 2-dehydrogenase/D-chiro-inositol 1-dehydrogenase
LGIIGTGNTGTNHLKGIVALQNIGLLDIDIVALCDIDSDLLKKTAKEFKVKKTYENYEDLIDDENVDVVYICTPTNKHQDMVKSAAKSKKHILCEKPLANSSPQAQDLMAVTKSAEVQTSVGLLLRYDPFLLFARNLIAEHDFGIPMLARVRDDQLFPADHVYYSKYRADTSIVSGGALIEHSIYDIDVLRWLFGEIENVYAKINSFSGREVEDHASLIMTHKSGMVSTLNSVWHMVERPNERFLEFFFEKGYIGIRLESGKKYLEYHKQGEGPVRIWDETANPVLIEELGLQAKGLSQDVLNSFTSSGTARYAALSYAFLSSLHDDRCKSPDFMDAVAAHRIVDAAYESSEKGNPVVLL